MRQYILPLLGVLVLATACSPKEDTSNEYVVVKNGKFYQGHNEYRYVGTNFWYGAILGSEGRGGNRQRLIEELDDMQQIGINNVRVLVGGDGREGIPSHIAPKLQIAPGVYNDTLLQGLDFMMAELEKRQMKAVLYFNNAWEWSGGYGAYLDWVGFEGDVYTSDGSGQTKHFCQTPVPSYDGWWEYMQYVGNFVLNDSAKTLAANHVRNIVTRTNTITGQPYSESKALMSWEIANEPRCFVNDSLHKAKFVEWIDEQSTLIKSLDPNHLVTTGSEGRNGCEEDMDLFDAIHTLPNIDYACIHIWPNNWGWLGKFNQNYDADKTIAEDALDPIVDGVEIACQKTLAYIDEAYAYTSKAGRPLVLEEFGYPRDRFLFTPGSATQGRDAYYEYVFSIIRDSGKLAGCNFWGWGGKANVKNVIWQPYDDYVCDPAQEEQGLNSIFANDVSTLEIIRQANRSLSCHADLCSTNEEWVWDGEDKPEFSIIITDSVNPVLGKYSVYITTDTQDTVFFRQVTNRKRLSTLNIDIQLSHITPGFYHVFVTDGMGHNLVDNAYEHWGGKKHRPFYVIGYKPEQIVSEPDPQPDFQEFWDKTRTELAAIPLSPQVKELKDKSTTAKRVYNAKVLGLWGDTVQIRYSVPTQTGKYPIHIYNMGYSSKPWDLDTSNTDWIEAIVSSHGQGSNEISNRFGDWVQYGLDDPYNYYYRGAYLDCSRAIDYLFSLPAADTNNIFLEGGSQGGAYSMACAALDHRVTAIACYITFMSDFPDYFQIVEWPYSAIRQKQQELGMTDEQMYRNLSYFDIKNLAGWIECPVYLGIGLQDETCPPHTNISGYNLVNAPKQLHIYRNYGHHVDYSHWTPSMMEWYNKWKK